MNALNRDNLPVPGLDMEGESAADFIEAIAELYTGVDRWHVRRLAASLRAGPAEAEKDSSSLSADELRDMLREVGSASSDARFAASSLEDAEDRIRDALRRLETGKVGHRG